MTGFSKSEVQTIALDGAPSPQGGAALRSRRREVAFQERDAPRALPGSHPAGRRRAGPDPRTPRAGRALHRSRTRTIEVRVDADGDPELELWAARRKGDLFEALAGRKLRFAVDGIRDAKSRPCCRHPPRREEVSATALRVIKRASG